MTNDRILYIITKSELGGAQSHVLDLIRGLHSRNDVHLATSVEGPLTDGAHELGVPVHLIGSLKRQINPFKDSACVQECAALIRRVQPSLVHAHSSKAGIVGRFAARIAGTPSVFTAHGWAFSPGTPVVRRMVALIGERTAAHLAKRVICVSETDRQLALRYGVGSPASLTTIHYGINAGQFPQAQPSTEPLHIVMVARFNEQKDQSTLLKAFARLSNKEVRLSFIGSGPLLEQARSQAQSLGVSDRTCFLGDRHDVPDLLAQAGCFVLSTHYEGLPISIMEAMRAGLPVIATDVSGISEEVTHGETGLLVPHADEEALLGSLQTLVASPELRKQLGDAGRRKFMRDFTVERMLGQVEAVYEDVLAAPSKRTVTQLGKV